MNSWLLRTVCLCVCVGMLLATARSAATAHAQLQSARTAHAEAVQTAHRLALARASGDTAAAAAHVQDAMVARVSASLTRAGIPVARMTRLSPRSRGATGPTVRLSDGTSVRPVHRSASLSLDQVSLPDLGGFLQAWRTEQPAWRVTSLEATPIPHRPGDVPTGKSLPGNTLARPLTIHLTLESTGIEHESPLR
jgi:hypothetical protein